MPGAAIASIATTNGSLTVTGYDSASGVVTYSYTSASAEDHTAGDVTDNITITVTDTDSDTGTDSLDILITDTAPTANADSGSTKEGGSDVTGNLITGIGSATADTLGADAPTTVTGVTQGSITFTPGGPAQATAGGGTLQINADGSYTYTPPATTTAYIGTSSGRSPTDLLPYYLTLHRIFPTQISSQTTYEEFRNDPVQ